MTRVEPSAKERAYRHTKAGILDGTLPAGLHRAAATADEAARWLDFLTEHGLRTT